MIYYSDLTQIIYSWANDLNNVEGVTHEMEPQADRFVISFNNGRTLTVGCSIATISIDQVWINEPSNLFCEVRNNSEIRDYYRYNSYGFNLFIFTTLRNSIKDFKIKELRDETVKAIDSAIKEWLSHLDSSFLHDREEVKGVTPTYDGIKYTITKVELTVASRFYLTIGLANTIDLFINDKPVFYCIVNENRFDSFSLPPNIPSISLMTKDAFILLIHYVKKHVDALNKKPEPKISTMDSSEQKPETNDKLQTELSAPILKLIPEQKDSTDEQLLKSTNVKSFDELFEQLSSESIKHTPVPESMLQNDQNTMTAYDMYKQFTDDLKSLVNATGQPIITATQKPDRNRQMMHRIRPIVIKWLKDIVYSAGPFSSFEEVTPVGEQYSFILHGERDANISMEIPYGFIGVMFISFDGVRIMRIGPDDVVLLLPLYNIDPDIQINRLHLALYDVLNIKQRRSKIDEIIECIQNVIRTAYPDTQYSIVGKQIRIIKRGVGSDAPTGVIRIGFSYKPGYQLCIWKNNNYDNPSIEFDDNWKPIMIETQDMFVYKLYNWLRANFGSTPFRSIEDAGLIMKIVKERNIMQIPGIKNVLFNDTKRTTTVLFDDGTKTMSKTKDGETYDCEIGFAMCIMKKMYGNRSRFQKEIERWTTACERRNKKIADKATKKQDKNEEEVES